jgi:hypothetical protein
MTHFGETFLASCCDDNFLLAISRNGNKTGGFKGKVKEGKQGDISE